MEAEILVSITQLNCEHDKHVKYTSKRFDILNGFEIIEVKCSNCKKTLQVTIRRL